MKILRIVAVALLCASGATVAAEAPPAPSPAHDLVSYYFTMANAKAMFRQIAKQQIQADDGPEVREFIESVSTTLEIDGLVDLLAPHVESAVTAEEMKVCQDFIGSPLGKKVLDVSTQYESFEAATPALGAMPEAKELVAVLNAPCFQKMTAAITTDEASRQIHDYGTNLACDWVRTSMPDKLPLAQEQGMCKSAD